MGKILIGTCSWTDETLVKDGGFYPPEAKSAEARLKYYATQFPIVEVDSTYYFPPSERNSVSWIERTPADFTFNVKAYSLLTGHPTRPDSLYGDLRAQLPSDAKGAPARGMQPAAFARERRSAQAGVARIPSSPSASALSPKRSASEAIASAVSLDSSLRSSNTAASASSAGSRK